MKSCHVLFSFYSFLIFRIFIFIYLPCEYQKLNKNFNINVQIFYCDSPNSFYYHYTLLTRQKKILKQSLSLGNPYYSETGCLKKIIEEARKTSCWQLKDNNESIEIHQNFQNRILTIAIIKNIFINKAH